MKIKELSCDYCNKVFYRPTWKVKSYPSRKQEHNFCSRRCKDLWSSKNIRGEKHPNWKAAEVKCKQCGQVFHTKQCWVKSGRVKFCSKDCQYQWRSENIRGTNHPRFNRVLTSCSNCGKQITRVKWLLARGNYHFCSSSCTHQFLGRNSRTGKLSQCFLCGKQFYLPAWRATQAEHHFCSLECSLKWVHSQYTKPPTEPEKHLEAILAEDFPQFEYNGDGRLGITIGNFIPDFVNTNGKKQLIELFGDYYHSPEVIRDRWQRSELGRIMAYNSLGYCCLVIWEHELKDKQAVVAKVKQFMKHK